MRLAAAAVLTMIAGLHAGCGDHYRIVLEGDDGMALAYSCRDVEPLAMSEAEFGLVRRQAGRAMRYELQRNGEDRLAAIEAAFRSGDDAELELALVDYACRFGDFAVRAPRFPEGGSEPPAFTLPVLDAAAAEVELAGLAGKVVVMNFWATWCGPCRQEYPELVELAREFADSGVVVLGVLKDDTPEAARRWVAEHDSDFPTLLDPSGTVSRAYQVRAIPHTFVIGSDGTVASTVLGYQAGSLRRRVIEALGEPR